MGPESDRISTNQNDHDNVEARDRITFAQESTHPNTIPKRTDTSELATSDTTQYETHPSSLKKHNVVADKELKFEKLEIGERDERDFQKRQEFGGRRLFWYSRLHSTSKHSVFYDAKPVSIHRSLKNK